MTAPKLFVSYSWTNPDHEAWVLRLATDLVDNGIDVIIDKWNLGKGHDANAFMEQMATNPDIKKVILICDRGYKERADGRKGGAGTEAQIITPQIYDTQDQNKFVAVLSERDADGKALVPAFYSSRIYIDLSDPTAFGSNFEELVRWVFDKPLYVKPTIGKPPAYILSDHEVVRLGTSTYQKRAIEAIRSTRSNAAAMLGEYLSKLLEELEKFRLSGSNVDNFEDDVLKSVADFLPYRDEFLEAMSVVAVFMANDDAGIQIHRFLEGLISYMNQPSWTGSWSSWDFDNYRFISYEMYLGLLAILVRHEQFPLMQLIIDKEYFVGNIPGLENSEMMGPEVFMHHLESFEAANQKSSTRKITKVGDILHDRSKHTYYEFRHLCTADVMLHIRTRLQSRGFMHWYAVTPIYLHYSRSSLEVFARCRSKAYFDKIRPILGVAGAAEFKQFISNLQNTGNDNFGRGYGRGMPLSSLVNIENVATAP